MKRFLLLSCFVLFCGALESAVYYVSPAGNDRDPGLSPEKPLKTVTCALNRAKSGDTVVLRGGVYREQVVRVWDRKNPKPITVKACPDETPVISFGWEVEKWRKLPGGLLAASFPYAVCDLWQKLTLDRYLKVEARDLIDDQPGSFFQDLSDGTIYVNPLPGTFPADPDDAGFVAVPYGENGAPLPFNTKKALAPRHGIFLAGENIHVEGIHAAFHGRSGIAIRGSKTLATSGSVRNCTVVGTTCGFRLNGNINGFAVENCRAFRNCGAGIALGKDLRNITIRNNFLLDNGNCSPFYGNFTDTSGRVHGIARYGGYTEYIDFLSNTVIQLDRSRQGGLLRCKGGVRKKTDVLYNTLIGGGVSMYAVPGSKARMSHNTVVPGTFHFVASTTGKPYTPEMIGNITSTGHNWLKTARFANPARNDYRLLPDSPYLGKGAAPKPAPVWFVKPGAPASGSGRTPEKPLGSLARLQGVLKSGDTVYFMGGKYSGTLNLKGLTDVTLSSMDASPVSWNKSTLVFDGCRGIRVDRMAFHDGRFTFADSFVEMKECSFIDGAFAGKGGKLLFANSCLSGCSVQSSGRAVFRENLLDRVKVGVCELVSEHNGFLDDGERRAWPVKGTFPNFTAGVKQPDGRVTVPLKNLLRGSDATWIGTAPVPQVWPPLEVKELTLTPLACGTRAVVSWHTPRDYVEAVVIAVQNGKKAAEAKQWFGSYLSTRGELCLTGLRPGVPCRVTVVLRRYNERSNWKKVLDFTPEKKAPSAPRVLKAGPGEKYATVAAALRAARSGDTVLIAPGTYREMLNVFTDGLTVKAARPGTVKLSGKYMFDYILQADNIKGLTIDGIDFTGLRYSGATRALSMLRSTGIRVVNCRFYPGRPRMGNCQFYGSDLKDVFISNCLFDNGFYAVLFMKADKVKIDHNTFWGTGVNAIHIAGGPGAEIVVTNNIFSDVVSNHANCAVSVGDPKCKVNCDWNLYWKTDKRCPLQRLFGKAGVLGVNSTGHVLQKDACITIEEARKRYGVETHGLFADPKLKDPVSGGDFSLLPGSPALKRGSDGRDLGADLTVFKEK